MHIFYSFKKEILFYMEFM